MKLVIFDLGRVLVRICDDWMHACATAGIDLANNDLGGAELLRLRDLVHQVEVHTIDFATFAQEAGAILGASPDQITRASAAFVIGLYEGVPELLSELAGAGVKTACLSNTNEHHWGLLSDREHPAFFPLSKLDHQFASHLIRARKPDTTIYVHVEETANIRGAEILFFDDVEENVRAARKRGWIAEWIDPEVHDPMRQIRAALDAHGVL